MRKKVLSACGGEGWLWSRRQLFVCVRGEEKTFDGDARVWGGPEVLRGERRSRGTVSATMESLVSTTMELRVMLHGEEECNDVEESEREGKKRVSASMDFKGFQFYLVL